MPGFVKCPVCGLDNDRDNVLKYRMCSHCGAQMEAGPIAPAGDGGQTPYVAPSPPAAGVPPMPPMGAPPPYGAYPPPPPMPPYPYGVPYGMPWPPTFHPGVYEKPEEPHRLDLGAMVDVLLHPKAAFERLYPRTGAAQGLIMAFLFIVLSSLISYALTAVLTAGTDVPSGTDTNIVPTVSVTTEVAQVALSLGLSVITFIGAAYLVYALLKVGGARRPNLEKTIGLVGYAKLPAFLMYIPLYLVMDYMIIAVDWDEVRRQTGANATGIVGDWVGTVCGIAIVLLVLVIIMFVWGLLVHSHAASVANDVSFGTAVGFTFLAWFIMFLIYVAIGFVIGLSAATL